MMMERVVGGCVVCVAGVALACDVWERHVDALLASACKTGHAPSRGHSYFRLTHKYCEVAALGAVRSPTAI